MAAILLCLAICGASIWLLSLKGFEQVQDDANDEK